MRIRTKPVYANAEQYEAGKPAPLGVCFCMMLPAHPHFHSRRGLRKVKSGDWIIRSDGAAGSVFCVSDKDFKNCYEAVK